MRGALQRAVGRYRNPDIAIFHDFRPPPYGGANQFLLALRGELRRRGLRVEANAIGPRTRASLLNSFAFDDTRLRRTSREGMRVVHRVDGPVATYRGFDDGSDARIVELNRLADVTVFQSRYSLEAHRELGIMLRNPVLITNAVDPSIFYPAELREPPRGRRARIIATSWSDNPGKGGETYRWLERNLDSARYELTFVGRARVVLEHARVIPPVPSPELADLLRAHDVYVAASANDPCSNALLEALACGLPAAFLRSGGHPEIVGRGGLGFTEPEELLVVLDRLVEDYEQYQTAVETVPLARVAGLYLEALLGAPA